MLQEVAIVDRAQAEVLEEVVAVGLDRVVELASIGGHELRGAIVDESELGAHFNGLAEGVDLLVLDFLVDVGREEPRSELVLGLFGGEGCRRLDGETVELRGGRPVVEPADGAGSDCLLYTSPSPRDGLLSRMPSSA